MASAAPFTVRYGLVGCTLVVAVVLVGISVLLGLRLRSSAHRSTSPRRHRSPPPAPCPQAAARGACRGWLLCINESRKRHDCATVARSLPVWCRLQRLCRRGSRRPEPNAPPERQQNDARPRQPADGANWAPSWAPS